MHTYTPREFSLPSLDGISEQNITEHLKLYEGYVKNTNAILEQMAQQPADSAYASKEMRRRLGFEFDGMRNHEYFFEQWEGGPQDPDESSAVYQKLVEAFGSFDAWKEDFFATAKTRGIGWAITYYDPIGDTCMNAWVDEQHLGHPQGAQFLIGIDMWEHAFVYDYPTSEKGQYIEAWYKNLNWGVIEKRMNT